MELFHGLHICSSYSLTVFLTMNLQTGGGVTSLEYLTSKVRTPTTAFIHSFIPLACAECDNSLRFSGASSIPLCYVLFPATLLHQLFFHPPSLHLAIYFLVYLSILLFPNSYIIPFWEFYFLSFSVHAQTSVIYLTLFSLLYQIFTEETQALLGG